MPYARLKQAVRVAAEREAQEERNRWLRTAFLGHQISAPYRKQPLSFAQYTRHLGLAPSPARAHAAPEEDLAEVKRRALATADRIRAMDHVRH